jgi:nucleotide-binding universal stress UspA family protein
MSTNPILVGYDGSRYAEVALNWAMAEAGRRDVPVRLVYVYEWASTVVPVPAGSAWPDPAVRHETATTIDAIVARVRAAHPEVAVQGMVVDGNVVSCLRKLSEHARLVVLGDRGLGGFTGLLAGSVAVGVAAHAACPVVVVRGCAPHAQPVVVGVDESPDSDHAIGFAFEQAATRGVGLVAVRAWQPPPVLRRSGIRSLTYDVNELEAAQRRLVGQALDGWLDKYPEVAVTVRLMPSTAAHALIAASGDAQLVVVGSRGRGGFHGLLLGSVARQLIHHAHCPVAVVRDTVAVER